MITYTEPLYIHILIWRHVLLLRFVSVSYTHLDVYKRQQHNHFIDTKNITLLHNIQKGKEMDLLEILELSDQI